MVATVLDSSEPLFQVCIHRVSVYKSQSIEIRLIITFNKYKNYPTVQYT